MTIIDPAQPIGAFAARHPGVVHILEDEHVDYHTEGGRSLVDACEAAGRSVARLVARLERVVVLERAHDWNTAPLSQLVAHLVDGHHAFTRELLRRSQAELTLAVRQHPERRSLADLEDSLRAFAEDLQAHLEKEESVLFPHVLQLDHHHDLAETPFTSVEYPLRVLHVDHESVEDRLGELRRLADDYAPPPVASASLRAIYADLASLERDLHEHLHLENNVLFPRAAEIEQKLLGPGVSRRPSYRP